MGSGVRAMVGVCGSPGGQREGRVMGGDCAVGCVVSVYVSARSGALAWSVVGRALRKGSCRLLLLLQGFCRQACLFGGPLGQWWEGGMLALG